MTQKNVEVLKFFEFLKGNSDMWEKIKEIREPKLLIDFAKENGFYFSFEDLTDYVKEISELSDEDLLDVAGGISIKDVRKDLFVFMMGLGLPFSAASGVGASPIPSGNFSVGYDVSQRVDSECGLRSYLKEAKISATQERAYEMIQNICGSLLKNKNKMFSSYEWGKINSYRNFKNSKCTEVEKYLDEAVEKGDVPIEAFTVGDINREADLVGDNANGEKSSFEVRVGVDALELSNKCAEDGSIVQVASQFNALESTGTFFSAVTDWPLDRTQGPRAALQSVAAAKHRESAYLKHKLPDAMYDLLSKCKLADNRTILEKYPNVYKGGYLELWRMNDVNDLKILRDFLKNNIGELKFLSQWVKCDGNGKKQLQVFSAAPSFQGVMMNWSGKDSKTKLLSEICNIIVVEEYRAIAKAAKIRAAETGKRTDVHLTLVGQGAFNNPEDVVDNIVKCLKEELEGTHDIKVFLHAYKDALQWTIPLDRDSVSYTVKY